MENDVLLLPPIEEYFNIKIDAIYAIIYRLVNDLPSVLKVKNSYFEFLIIVIFYKNII